MKKIFVLLIGVLAVGQAFAGTLCTLGAPTNANYALPTPTLFVVRSFPVKCSANVDATHQETAVAFGVGALSTKGKSYFVGTTAGGQVSGSACGVTCVAGGQAAALATAMLTAT